jgi:hypothetical protein
LLARLFEDISMSRKPTGRVKQCSFCGRSAKPRDMMSVNGVDECMSCVSVRTKKASVDDYLSEQGLVALPKEPPGYALDILKRVRDGELGNCLAYRMITEQNL